MSDVKFIQYLRPDGRQRPMLIERPDAVADKAKRIWEAGFRLEIEVLTTGLISMTVSDDSDDYAHVLHENGPGLENAVDQLIMGFTFPQSSKGVETLDRREKSSA